MVDIIVRAKDGHALTRECLTSIRKNTPAGTYRIILVDDGSDPEFGSSLSDIYVRNRYPKGAVTATNLGLGIALTTDAPYVLIFDNDTRVPEGDTGWLERFVKELEQGGPQVACVGATTNFANVPQQILSAPATYTAEWKDEATGRFGFKDNPPVLWFISFAVLFRKPVLAQLGLWDERYNPGNWEDTDYAVRVRQAGYQIKVARSVYIHHKGHQTFKDELRKLLIENGEKFQNKWGVGRLFDMGYVSAEQLKEALQ